MFTPSPSSLKTNFAKAHITHSSRNRFREPNLKNTGERGDEEDFEGGAFFPESTFC